MAVVKQPDVFTCLYNNPKNGLLYTPEQGVLQGVTRKSIIDVAQTYGLGVQI